MEQEIIDYISQAQKHGLSDFEIKQNLLNAGWEAGTVEKNFVLSKAAENNPTSEKNHPLPDNRNSIEQAVFPLSQTTTITKPTPQPVLSVEQLASPSHRISGKILGIIIAAFLVLLGASAYGYYAIVLNSPAKIWEKYTQSTPGSIYQTKFSLSYEDKGTFGSKDELVINPPSISNLKVSVSGSGYLDKSDSQNLQTNAKAQFAISNDGKNFSEGIEYILKNKVLYLNSGDGSIFKNLTSSFGIGQKIDWVKIDFNKLNSQNPSQKAEALLYSKLTGADFKSQFEKLWQNTKIVKQDKFLGNEVLGGVKTLHYQNSVDKDSIKTFVLQYMDQSVKTFNSQEQKIPADYVNTAKEVISQLIDKIQIKEFETWIGAGDLKLYRVHFISNAPSLVSFIKNAREIQIPTSKDAKRLADTSKMASALEIYNSEKGGYPDGSNGQPAGLTPNYISQIPLAPAPDGTCTDYYNTYWYQPEGAPKTVNGVKVYPNYSFTFCLGADAAGYKAGIAKLTPKGIEDNIPCPTTAEQCIKTASIADPKDSLNQQIKNLVNKLDFSAEIKADADYTDYGKKTEITLPVNPFDLIENMNKSLVSTDDSQRLTEIRQLESALELYFNDNKAYPDKLPDLLPNYISAIPTAPEPSQTAGIQLCSKQDNTYTYQKISGSKYTLNFCLGTSIGGYSAGKHILSDSGIQ